MSAVSVQTDDIDVAAELAALEALGGGGVASFTGIVRGDEDVVALELEHHPGMTVPQIEGIVAQAMARWPLLGARVIHRVGKLDTGARIVFVGTAARHRTAALEACAFLIDWLKVAAPFWKKTHHADGRHSWVEARAADSAKAEQWRA